MACIKNKFTSSILLIILIIVCVNASKLNVPRVLLPLFKDLTLNYTLEVTEDEGCYKWSTTQPDSIVIHVIDEDPFLSCSTKVIVTAAKRVSSKVNAIVLAEEVRSAATLRCDVVLDHIHTLDIISKTRELYLTEAPEVFEIRALDSQGNEFSTLEGVYFEWSIVTLGKRKDAEVIRCMPFSAFDYEAPDSIILLESYNRKGYMALLEGVNTGAAKVCISLPYTEYISVPVLEIQITVAANIILQPAEAYLMIGDYIEFKIYVIIGGKMDEIQLPGSQYFIDSKNYKIAKVAKKKAQVFAMAVGTTQIELLDTNAIKSESPIKAPSATVYVVVPFYLQLAVLPFRNWAVLIGERHDVVAEVYTKADHKLTLGLGVKVDMHVTNHFQIEERSRNGTWMSGWCAKKGVAVVDASLQHVSNPVYGTFKLDKPLTSRGEILIFSRITITPPEVVLPWDDISRPKYDMDLVATGGDGKFLWTTNDHTKGLVTQTGHVRTLGSGSFEVSAAMLRNHHNRQTVKFSIYLPAKLEIVDHVMEAEIGHPVHVNIALYAEKPGSEGENPTYIPFTRCQSLPFRLRLSNERFKQNRSEVAEPVGVSCANLALVAFEQGTAKLTIAYLVDGKLLEDVATISAYKPIKLEQPTGDIVLSVGASGMLVFTGGPQPPIAKPSEHYRVVTTTKTDIAISRDVSQPHVMLIEDFSVIEVICMKLGETDMLLRISNQPIVPNCKSHAGSIVVKIICGKPRTVALRPELKIVDNDTCPMDMTADTVVVQSKQNIVLDVSVLDHLGRRFLNISSYLFDWKTDENGAVLCQSVLPRAHTVGTVLIPHRSYQVIRPMVDNGTIHVSVTITSYNMSVLAPLGVVPEWPEFVTSEDRLLGALQPITASLQLILVENTNLDPMESNLYNNPANKRIVNITHGSGYYKITLSSNELAQVNYHEDNHEIEVIPMQTGELFIEVTDLCLPTHPTTAMVHIVAVGIIRVEMSDKVEMGKCIHAIVRLYDEHDNLMLLEDVDVVPMKIDLSHEIARLDRMPFDNGENWPMGEVHYLVTGNELGEAKLTFSVNSGFLEVQSAPVELQVFAPLRLYPRNGSLLVGATIQISTKGGPVPHVLLEYLVTPPEFAEISNRGILIGKAVGHIEINCKSVGIHPTTGRKVIYSEDTSTLKILTLPAIKIAAPLSRLKVGATVPCWASGIPETLSPMVMGTIEDPAVQFDWDVDDQEVALLSETFTKLGISYLKQDKLAIRLTGLAPGKTKLTLNITLNGASTDLEDMSFVTFSTFLEIEVFDELQIIAPGGYISSSILMAPHSQLKLETNFEDLHNLQYKLQGEVMSTMKPGEGTVVMNSYISLSKRGELHASSVCGDSTVKITAKDEYGLKQVLVIIVQVREIHYMVVEARASWMLQGKSRMHFLPLGVEVILKAHYFDSVGNKFDAGPGSLQVRTSRCDLLKVKPGPSNHSVIVSIKKPGHTVMKVWSEGIQQTAEYFKIHAELVRKPLLIHVTRGDILCLYTPLVAISKEMKHKGRWLTSDKSLIDLMDAPVDIAYVTGNREGICVLSHSLHPSSPFQLQVLPVQDIVLFQTEQGGYITNYDNDDEVFRTHVVLHSEMSFDVKFSNLMHGWNCHDDVKRLVTDMPFTCFVAFSNRSQPVRANNIFTIRSIFVSTTGQYACELTSTHNNESAVSTLDSKVQIWALSVDDPDIVSPKLDIPFLPGVYTPKELLLPLSGVGELIVTGLPFILDFIRVTPADGSIIYTDKGIRDGYRKIYIVQILDYHWRLADVEEAMAIFIQSANTNQTIKVLVKVPEGYIPGGSCQDQSPLFAFLNRYKHIFAIIVSMLVIFLASFYVYSHYLQPVINVNVQPRGPTGLCARVPQLRNASFACSHGPNCSCTQCPGVTSCSHPNNCSCLQCSGRSDPVYGDVSSFYNTSPDVRRNRRFI